MNEQELLQVLESTIENPSVTMSNLVVRAKHDLTLGEKRILMMCLSKVDSRHMEDSRFKIKLYAKDYAKMFEISNKTAYEQLKNVSTALYNRSIKHIIINRKNKEIVHLFRWVSGITYHDGEGFIELGFSPEITPYLVNLKSDFTSYKLQSATALRSVYSWRLLELLMQFKSTGLLRIPLNEFCHAMEVSDNYANTYKELRRRVIEPAVKELNKHKHLAIEWKPMKQGYRLVSGLEFRFKVISENALPKPKRRATKPKAAKGTDADTA
jgi:plasmid replication initiation protein